MCPVAALYWDSFRAAVVNIRFEAALRNLAIV